MPKLNFLGPDEPKNPLDIRNCPKHFIMKKYLTIRFEAFIYNSEILPLLSVYTCCIVPGNYLPCAINTTIKQAVIRYEFGGRHQNSGKSFASIYNAILIFNHNFK